MNKNNMNTVPEEELNLRLRADRIGVFFTEHLKEFIFMEVSQDFLQKFEAEYILKDIPVPFRKEDLESFKTGKGLSIKEIADNMFWVIGCDPHFKYAESYISFLLRIFGKSLTEEILLKGNDAADKACYDEAVIMFRACLLLESDNLNAMYSYARTCTKLYEDNTDTEYVGRMKAEAIDFFELTACIYPEFDKSYYYLGYIYVNMGLYLKAKLTWKEFLKLSEDEKEKAEIESRLLQIEDAVIIEEGCNDIIAGRYDEGRKKLIPFADSEYDNWWPLHYYLGVGYRNSGESGEAEKSLLRVLKLNGSHLETMRELYDIYQERGDEVLSDKYLRKIEIITSQIKEEESE